MRAKLRDYRRGDLIPALLDGEEIMIPASPQSYESWQPDGLDGEQYNLVLLIGYEFYRVQSFDFDFVRE